MRLTTTLVATVAVLATLGQAATDWPVFFEHLGRVHSIHNKWELTFAVKTSFRYFEGKLQNISKQIDEFRPRVQEEGTLEFAADKSEGEDTEEDQLFRLVNEHWEGLADLLKRRSESLLRRLGDYR